MRGKATMLQMCTELNGITPAYAGKSIENELFTGNEQDHPRLCGEKYLIPK